VSKSARAKFIDRVYRCPVCRLQMMFDLVLQKMKPDPPNGNNGNGDKDRRVA
jgi:hypothetical protein